MTLEAAIAAKRTEREEAVNASPQAEVAGKLNALTKELVDVDFVSRECNGKYVSSGREVRALLDQQEQASPRVSETTAYRRRAVPAPPMMRARCSATASSKWFVTLGTQNTKTAHFDEDFKLFVDSARFSTTTHQSGAARARIVLAFHAATP